MQKNIPQTQSYILLSILFLITTILSKSLPPQIPTTINKYQLRRPLRYSYYRLNSKLQFNPILGHIVKNRHICSSKLGPFCQSINDQILQEYQIVQDKLTEQQKNAYRIQKSYQPIRFQLALEIEKKIHNYFLIPSNQYKMLDQVVKANVKDLIHVENMDLEDKGQKNKKTNVK